MKSPHDGSYIGYRKLKQGCIHLFCPSCGRKMSNRTRADRDPPSAVLVHAECPNCAVGRSLVYLDAEGNWLDPIPERESAL